MKIEKKPADGMTLGQPFASGTGGSQYFRIPSLITLKDGTLLAAADVRWNHTGDGFCLDTMVSRSEDGGKTWHYTFANYLEDNGNEYHPLSTAFIDPAMTEKDGVVYLLVDLYSGGRYVITAEPGTGFENGDLILKKAGEESWEYRLRLCGTGRYGIFTADGIQIENVWADPYFNWYDKEDMAEPVSNLFFADSEWQAYPVCHLYLTKSADGGKSWSEPLLVNPQVKKENEIFYGVGPGRGLTLASGRIIFPCYTFNGVVNQRASFIYSDDDGITWTRVPHITDEIYSGEDQLVELLNGNLRCFFRNNQCQICYADAAWKNGEYEWGPVVKTGMVSCPDCQLSAFSYSKTVEGKQMIFVSCPADKKERQHGMIYLALTDMDGNTQWKEFLELNGEAEVFSYSCLTECKDGNLAILYEDSYGSIVFKKIEMRGYGNGEG